MDGFDLGIGILFPLFEPGEERDAAMNSVAPVWDGNETWLVLGGGGLFAAFPLAYAIIMPALYAPIIAMLLGLIFRGVAFEFRWRDPAQRAFWDVAFTGGSIVAALAQGMALGALLQGIAVEGRAYAGGWWDWLTPFSLLTASALVVGYALLGATWLIMKTEGELQDRARALSPLARRRARSAASRRSALATPFLEVRVLASAGSPGQRARSPRRCRSLVAIAAVVCSFARSQARRERAPFLLALALFGCPSSGSDQHLARLVPGRVTIWEAAAPADEPGLHAGRRRRS